MRREAVMRRGVARARARARARATTTAAGGTVGGRVAAVGWTRAAVKGSGEQAESRAVASPALDLAGAGCGGTRGIRSSMCTPTSPS